MHVVVANADSTDARPILSALHTEGHTTRQVHTGSDAFKTLLLTQVDALILDGSLPDMDRLDLCATLRTIDFAGVIMVVTETADTMSTLEAFRCGADSCMTDPAAPVEIVARVEAIHRLVRSRAATVTTMLPRAISCKRRTVRRRARSHSFRYLYPGMRRF